MRRIAELKSRLQRTNPVEHADRLQPDVRRAGRPRAAPPQPPRPRGRRPRETARPRPAVAVGAGERVLAWADRRVGEVVAGTRDALYLGRPAGCPGSRSRPPTGTATPPCSGSARSARGASSGVEHAFALDEPGRLLELVRERVTASVVLQRHVPISGRRGAARDRPPRPRGDRPLAWFFEYDEGVDPDDPAVRAGRRGGAGRRPRRGRARSDSERSISPAGAALLRFPLARSPVAQLAEHSAVNRRVVGSSPTGGASTDGRTCRVRPSGIS